MFNQNTRSLSICALVAAAGMAMPVQAADWASPVDGNWNIAANWLPADIPNVVGEDANLGFATPYTVFVSNSFTISAMNITNTNAVASLGNITLTLNDNLANQGMVIVNDNGNSFNSALRFGVDAALLGSGSVFLNGVGATNDASIGANSTWTMAQAAAHTIHGNGEIVGTMINNGSILADTPAGAGLAIAGTVTQLGSGTIGADAGEILLANNSSISGGQLFSINGGRVAVSSGTANIGDIDFSGVLDIPGGSRTLAVFDAVTNNGTVNINSDNAAFNAHLRATADVTINGAGTITMQSPGNTGDAQILANDGFTLTFGSGQTVQGAGLIQGLGATGTVHNAGTFIGNDPVLPLEMYGNHTGAGTYRGDDGVLGLANGSSLNGGTFDSSGTGSVEALAGTSTISNIVNNGQMGIRGQSTTLTLVGPFTNNGDIAVNSDNAVFNAHLRADADVTINGTGTITMQSPGNTGDAQIRANDGFTLTFGSGQTVQGAGSIEGFTTGIIHNEGTFIGNDPTLPLEMYGNHTGTGTYRGDNGVLGLANGSSLNGGTFDSSGTGSVEALAGTSTISNIVNNGQMGIRGNAVWVDMVSNFTNNGTVNINSDNAVFNAHLRATADVTIDGTGTITMQSPGNTGDAQILANDGFTLTFGSGQTIQGAGSIKGLTTGVVRNEGTFIGNDPVLPLEMYGNHTGAGTYRGDDGVLGLASGSSLNGGTFDSSGTGSVEALAGTSTISNIVNNGQMGIRGNAVWVDMATNFTNNGTVNINSDNAVFNAHLRAVADVAINGTGTITMQSPGNTGDAQIRANGFTLTIGSGQTITGSGSIQGTVTLEGTIDPGGLPLRRIDIDDLALAASSTINVDLGGLLDGEFDRILLGGSDTIDLGGASIVVALDSGYLPAFGDTWDIIDGGTIIGSLGSVTVPTAPPAQIYRVIEEPTRVFVALTCHADFTGDNFIDVADVFKFLYFYNTGDLEADFTGDGILDISDVFLFLTFYNGGCTGV